MRRWRTLLALICIAALAFAVAVPGGGAGDLLAFLMPVWLEFQPDVRVTLAHADALSAPEQPVSLRSVASFRAPPAA
jgi:hypothetical protein